MIITAGSFGLFALFGMTAVAVAMTAAAIMLIRESLRSERRMRALEAEIELHNDAIWDLRESEERTRSILDGQGDLIVRRDADGRIAYANDAFCALASRPRTDLLGSGFSFPVIAAGLAEMRDDGVARRDEAIETPSGRRWIEWQDVPVRGTKHSRPEVQSVGRDVTRRREAEEIAARTRDAAEAANEAKSRFLAAITHEIRTPLGGMLGMADLLIDTALTPEQTTYATAVRTSGRALLSLIDEILDFSKIEAGHLTLEDKPFALGSLVEEVVELLAPRAHAKGIEIAAHVGAGLPMHVVGDAGRLKQVLLNLLGNAVKFTVEGGVAFRVASAGETGAIAFEIADTGIGIAPDQQARIFREFEQADATPARRFGGTGLGLAISQRIVRQMGGLIAVESTPGRGSRFRFALPLAAASPAAAATMRGSAPPGERRALVASPSPVVGPMLAAMLADIGVEARLAAGLADASALIAAEPFGLVFCDRAYGADASGTIAASARAAGARIVMLLTPSERHEVGHAAAGAAPEYLIKPVRAASLHARIVGLPQIVPRQASASEAPARPLAGLAVLLAEDNDINALLARTLLTKLGAAVTWAKDGVEAVEAYSHWAESGARFDAVLMDLHMPRLDGHGAALAIRAAEALADLARTPIYALTANTQSEEREACLAAGMDECLTKPIDRDRLVALLVRPVSDTKADPAAVRSVGNVVLLSSAS